MRTRGLGTFAGDVDEAEGIDEMAESRHRHVLADRAAGEKRLAVPVAGNEKDTVALRGLDRAEGRGLVVESERPGGGRGPRESHGQVAGAAA
jgi:hypothetical protein